MAPIAKSLGVPVVPYAEWLAKLEKTLAAEAARENPALRLIGFYRAAGRGDNPDREAFSNARLEKKQAVKASETLGDPSLPVLGKADTDRWLGYWRRIGVLKR